jgi:hypothetical protein
MGSSFFAREEANCLPAKLSDVSNELVVCRGKVETLSQSILAMKMKFRKAKEKLCEYKNEGSEFLPVAKFCFLGTRYGIFYGLSKRVLDFQRMGQKAGKFSQSRYHFPQRCCPLKKVISNVSSIGQREIPDYRGIKCMGFRPHLIYDSEARFQAQLPRGLIVPTNRMLILHNQSILLLNLGIVGKMMTSCIYRFSCLIFLNRILS